MIVVEKMFFCKTNPSWKPDKSQCWLGQWRVFSSSKRAENEPIPGESNLIQPNPTSFFQTTGWIEPIWTQFAVFEQRFQMA
jgi:hypothetical protein